MCIKKIAFFSEIVNKIDHFYSYMVLFHKMFDDIKKAIVQFLHKILDAKESNFRKCKKLGALKRISKNREEERHKN